MIPAVDGKKDKKEEKKIGKRKYDTHAMEAMEIGKKQHQICLIMLNNIKIQHIIRIRFLTVPRPHNISCQME